ncbi:DUF427 domain-containing protein [Paenibacillus anaericanus]|uniref:DUF427 domain-containing protein n=1 Tax=Paenibacillus anaericanus TaxID=170367 RepID=A0A3S1EKB3_9BACL|nr:DUF427 domain-containing protein [Paenibacillus anaericanus]RUT47435.1 DUF427 domain-containing protein [Paenibacillus anaericanus]
MAHHDPQWNLRDHYSEDWQIRAERSPKWIRVKLGDVYIADSKRVLSITETGKLPVYYFPKEDVRSDLFEVSDYRKEDSNKGEATYWSIRVGDRVVENAAWSYLNPPQLSSILTGYVSFVWNKADAWFEEEEEIYVHARDPYTRIDALPSTRHIKVVVGGRVIAESRSSVVLFETGLTPRFYLPQEDVNFDHLVPSDTITRCPYKGVASYHSIQVGGKEYRDVVWSYAEALPEVHEIAGRLSFYNEEVDAIYIDGEKWSLQSKDRLPYKKVGDK